MIDSFPLVTRLEPHDGALRAHLDASWNQGRGGRIAALFVRAIEAKAGADDRPLRGLIRLTAPRPAATVSITYHFLEDLSAGAGVLDGEHALVTSRSEVLEERDRRCASDEGIFDGSARGCTPQGTCP